MSVLRHNLDQSQPSRVAVADLLQAAILHGRILAGEEVPQLPLARELGLSQSSVREGLQELEHRGLIVKNGRRRSVISLSEDDLADLYQLRALLEPLACRLAAQCYRQIVDERLEGCLERMRDAALADDYLKYSEADYEFHYSIWKTQPNRLLEHHLERLCLPLWSYDLRQRRYAHGVNFERSLKQHRLILTALRTRDGSRAERLVKRLIERLGR